MAWDRIALVTGGNKGIGLEIARQLAQAGLRVVIGARGSQRGEAAVAGLAREGLEACCLRLDLADRDTLTQAAQHHAHDHGQLDVLVNNAGIFDFADAVPGKASIEAVRRVMEVNFIGTLAVTQAMLPLLRAAPEGRIVNLST